MSIFHDKCYHDLPQLTFLGLIALFHQTLESGRNLGKEDDRVSENPKYVFVNLTRGHSHCRQVDNLRLGTDGSGSSCRRAGENPGEGQGCSFETLSLSLSSHPAPYANQAPGVWLTRTRVAGSLERLTSDIQGQSPEHGPPGGNGGFKQAGEGIVRYDIRMLPSERLPVHYSLPLKKRYRELSGYYAGHANHEKRCSLADDGTCMVLVTSGWRYPGRRMRCGEAWSSLGAWLCPLAASSGRKGWIMAFRLMYVV